MTLCIAAACQENSEPRFVLCSDTKASYGALGSRHHTVKVDVLGRGWTVQLAGASIGVARDFIDDLKPIFSNAATPLTTPAQVEDVVSRTLNQRQQVQPLMGGLLLSGFIARTPIIVSAWDDDQNVMHVERQEAYAAIGEGRDAAYVMLNHREYREGLPIQTATYLVYEAKRIAEQVGSVGKDLSVICWQAPSGQSTPHEKANLKLLNGAALDLLNQLFQRLGPQPLPTIVPRRTN